MRVIIAREAGALRERLRQAVLGTGLQCAADDCVSFADLPGRLLLAPEPGATVNRSPSVGSG